MVKDKGVAESIVAGYLSSEYKDAVALRIMLTILFIRPIGIIGKSVDKGLKAISKGYRYGDIRIGKT